MGEEWRLIYHTHPGGTPYASQGDINLLGLYRQAGSPQRSSQVVLPDGNTIRFSSIHRKAGLDARWDVCTVMNIDDFSDIWEAPIEKYALIRVGQDANQMVIFDLENRIAELIDDDDIAHLVIERMIERGFAILDRWPG